MDLGKHTNIILWVVLITLGIVLFKMHKPQGIIKTNCAAILNQDDIEFGSGISSWGAAGTYLYQRRYCLQQKRINYHKKLFQEGKIL